jgi:2-hydroxychromene-2-carboxylate isomerase
MTRPRLSFFFDYSSPFAYLGSTQVEALAARHGADLAYCPFLLGALFKAIGTPDVPLFTAPQAKQRYISIDLERWARHYGVPFRFPSIFPMNTVSALRMTLEVENAKRPKLVAALFHALWSDDRDLRQPEVLAAIAGDAGYDGAALVAGMSRPEIKTALFEATANAEKAGVCGAPCFLVQASPDEAGVLFWGQDRLVLVERALDGWRPRSG